MFDCKLKIISPIHIGSGNEYNNSEFIHALAKNKKGEKFTLIKRINLQEYYKDLPNDKKDKFLVNLTNNISLKEFDNKISNKYLRYKTLDKTKNTPTTIKETIKTLDEAYIPGSSIKGSIKTALLYNELENIDVSEFIEEKFGKTRVNRKKWNKYVDNIFSTPKKNSAQYSIMRFLQTSDTTPTKLPKIYDLQTLKAKPNGKTEFHTLHGRTVRNFYETIDQTSLNFTLNNKTNDKILNQLKLNNKKHIISLDNIKESLYTQSKDIIKHEQEFAKKYNIKFLSNFYKNLENKNSLKTPLIRIGHSSGFLNTTIGLKIKNEDIFSFELLMETAPKSYEYEFPKSREITLNGGKPLGWAQINFNNGG